MSEQESKPGPAGRLWRLNITTTRADRSATLGLDGRLSHANARTLDEATRALLAADDVEHLVLDLSGVDYMSSAALGVVERLALDLSARGGRLLVRRPSQAVRLALELSGSSVQLVE